MAPIRVCQVVSVADSLIFFKGLPRYLRARGIEMTAVASPSSALQAFAAEEGAKIHAVDLPRAIAPAQDARSVLALARFLRNERFDIVHGHTPKGGLVAMLAAKLARVPVRIYTMHGAPMATASGLKRELLRNAERVTIAAATHALAVSPSLARYAAEERLSRIPLGVLGHGTLSGIDVQRFSPRTRAEHADSVRAELGLAADAFVFGFVGRLCLDKGITTVVAAFTEVRKHVPGARLLLVGDSDARDPMPDAVLRALRQDPAIVHVPFTQAIEHMYAAMDVLLLPSLREGFPTVPLEAAAMEIPTLVSDATGCVDSVIDQSTGRVLPMRDAQAWALAMLDCVAQPSVLVQWGQAARARAASDFSQDVVRESLVAFYRSSL